MCERVFWCRCRWNGWDPVSVYGVRCQAFNLIVLSPLLSLVGCSVLDAYRWAGLCVFPADFSTRESPLSRPGMCLGGGRLRDSDGIFQHD